MRARLRARSSVVLEGVAPCSSTPFVPGDATRSFGNPRSAAVASDVFGGVFARTPAVRSDSRDGRVIRRSRPAASSEYPGTAPASAPSLSASRLALSTTPADFSSTSASASAPSRARAARSLARSVSLSRSTFRLALTSEDSVAPPGR